MYEDAFSVMSSEFFLPLHQRIVFDGDDGGQNRQGFLFSQFTQKEKEAFAFLSQPSSAADIVADSVADRSVLGPHLLRTVKDSKGLFGLRIRTADCASKWTGCICNLAAPVTAHQAKAHLSGKSERRHRSSAALKVK